MSRSNSLCNQIQQSVNFLEVEALIILGFVTIEIEANNFYWPVHFNKLCIDMCSLCWLKLHFVLAKSSFKGLW